MWRDALHASAASSLESCANSTNSTSTTPSVAFCFAGASRTFPTPLLLEHHYHNLVRQLAPDNDAMGGSRVFLYLKLADSNKTHVGMPKGRQFMGQSWEANPIYRAMESSWIKRMLAEAVIIEGSGSYQGLGWTPGTPDGPAGALRHGDEQLAPSRRPKASRCAPAFEKLRSATEIALAGDWCGNAIARYEARSKAGSEFDLVAFVRPDQFLQKPVPPLCRFPYTTTVFVCVGGGSDGLWIASRRHADRLMHDMLKDHSACQDDGKTHQCQTRQIVDEQQVMLQSCRKGGQPPSCCGPGEALLAHAINRPIPLPIDRMLCMREFAPYSHNFARTGLLTSGWHTCDIAMDRQYSSSLRSTKAYANQFVHQMQTQGRLSQQQAYALRGTFQLNATACRLALAPITMPYDVGMVHEVAGD